METKPRLLILTGPQGSGNHLFAKIFSSHESVRGWEMEHDEWEGHHNERFSLYWRHPEIFKDSIVNWYEKYYITSISCPYFYNKKPTIPNYKKFIKYASRIFDIQVCIIGRDKNILLKQQKRVRSKHTTPTAIRNFKHLLKHNPIFISQELFCLYGIDYCNSISKLLNFPIDIKKVKELLKYNSNAPYIKQARGKFDAEVKKACEES